MELLERSCPRGRRLLRFGLIAVTALTSVGWGMSTASAVPLTPDPFGGGSQFTDVSVGSQADDVGDIWLKRSADSDGTGEILQVHIEVIDPGAIRESSVCVKETPFVDRELGGGGCTGLLVQQDNDGATSADYTIDLGTAFIGSTFYAQIHVTLTNGALGGTAFGGWLPGEPFYGNTPVSAPTCDEGSTFTDGNDNGIVEDGECHVPDATCPEGMTGSDANHNGTIDEGECVAPVVDATCPEGMTGSDVNHNGTIDGGECVAPIVDTGAVLGETITRAPSAEITQPSLALTGLETSVLLKLAGLLLIVGSSLQVGSRVRRRGQYS